MQQHLIFRLAIAAALIFMVSCGQAQMQGPADWEGVFSLPRGDEKAEAQLDFKDQTGMLGLPGIIPIPLRVSDMKQEGDSVFFSIGFRSGPAPCRALIANDTMRGIMSSSRGGEMAFWMARIRSAEALRNQPKPPASEPVVITAFSQTPDELEIKSQLEALLKKYDLEPYLYTKKVRIKEETIPHSHPVLTLSTDFQGKEVYLLSTFLHEQMHWYSLAKDYNQEALGAALVKMYPKVPIALPEGGGSEMGTYLHLLVCYLEYHTLARVIGETAALEHMEFMATQHYTWVYKTLLKDMDQLGALFKKHNLLFE